MNKTTRLLLLVVLFGILAMLAIVLVPKDTLNSPQSGLLYTSIILLSLTVLLVEHFFSRPTDVILAGFSIGLLLIPSPWLIEHWGIWYWLTLAYVSLMIIIATVALLALDPKAGPDSKRNIFSSTTKKISTTLGSARIQYFIIALLAILNFVDPATPAYTALIIYTLGVFIIQPNKWPSYITRLSPRSDKAIGKIMSVQGGNTFIVQLYPSHSRRSVRTSDLIEFQYSMDEPARMRRGFIIERFYLDQEQWVAVFCHSEIDNRASELKPLENTTPDVVYARNGEDAVEFLGSLVGIVREGSDIGTLRFLQAGRASVQEGDLIKVNMKEGPVLYQTLNGAVNVRRLEARNEADFILGEAVQLGRWNSQRGAFEKFGWVPPARTAVCVVNETPEVEIQQDEILLGYIPGTTFPILLNVDTAVTHHTAILGVTGVGKSVFARDLSRRIAEGGTKTIIVDFTREWKLHFNDARTMIDGDDEGKIYKNLSLLRQEMAKYADKRNESNIKSYKTEIYNSFKSSIEKFINSDNYISILELPDVSNDEDVMQFTHLFFKTLMRIARENHPSNNRICIVLEEAHTVVPEWNFMGIADKSSQAIVTSIGQIALQGRKYGVGFLVIAQRTASVSKTILTQCNTIIAFQCFDGTSLSFLDNYIPSNMTKSLPYLGFRRAIAVGKAVRGSVPLVFEVPHISESNNTSENPQE